MGIQWAEVIAGTERPLQVGTTGAASCTLRVNGRPVAGIIKRVSRQEVIAEAFSALLLRGWGLPVPDPYLVNEDGVLAYASGQSRYPNLMQRLGVDALPKNTPEWEAATHVAALVATSIINAPLAAAADEAIDNRDRNLGNILWDGQNDAWIDHAGAFEAQAHPDRNKLCSMADAAGATETFQQSALAQSLAMDRSVPAAACELAAGMLDAQHHATFVAKRLETLADRVLCRFPKPKDLLWEL